MPTILPAVPVLHATLAHCYHCWRFPFRSGWLLGWLTLAMVNAGIAQAKDRSGLFWFLASLVVGPLATLLLITMYARRA